ncbi:MAG TPA: hypothetical protein VGF19_08115 [Candidatus Acidoferrum sp.]
MSVTWYIVLEKEIVGYDARVNGKALGRAGKVLEMLAKELGVVPLMQFYSAAQDELTGFVEEHGTERTQIKFTQERWFEAEDGLRSVRGLIRAGERTGVTGKDPILDDLKAFERVLEAAKVNGVRWHLAVDY